MKHIDMSIILGRAYNRTLWLWAEYHQLLSDHPESRYYAEKESTYRVQLDELRDMVSGKEGMKNVDMMTILDRAHKMTSCLLRSARKALRRNPNNRSALEREDRCEKELREIAEMKNARTRKVQAS